MSRDERPGREHRLTLVLGGISSGKSEFALQLAHRFSHGRDDRVLVIATGQTSDPEMEARIVAHRRRRPAGWQVAEEALRPQRAIRRYPRVEVALIESIDSWVANCMEAAGVGQPGERLGELETGCLAAVEEVLALVPRVICVSSEVGLGGVPLYPLGRAFADLLGRLNQRLAALAAERFLVVAGTAFPLPPPDPEVKAGRRRRRCAR